MTAVHDFRLPSAPHPSSGLRSWGGTVARSLYAGVLIGMISGFLTLLIAILTVIVGKLLLQRLAFDITVIYRAVAPAVAICVAVLVFAGNIVWERTHPAPAPAERT
jgi:predicted lipid-binding transport protein (Tim44 family)